jgi:hypothetical protein
MVDAIQVYTHDKEEDKDQYELISEQGQSKKRERNLEILVPF